MNYCAANSDTGPEMPWRMDRFLNIEVLKHKWHIGREKKHRGKERVSVSLGGNGTSPSPSRTQADPELEHGTAAGVTGGQS